MEVTIKNEVLKSLAALILENKQKIIAANKEDLLLCQSKDESIIDRLKVNDQKVHGMIQSVEDVIQIEDPEGVTLYQHTPENGILIENKTVPFGKILIIYESRPDVTIEAAVAAFKSGNKIILKGGKEARITNLFLVSLWKAALESNECDADYVTYLDISREATQELIKGNTQKIDLIIPRGGDALINFVKQHSSIPMIISGRGNNFVYIDDESDFDMAIAIILNGKERISVCNAIDKVLINSNITDVKSKIAHLRQTLAENNIAVFGDSKANTIDTAITIDKSETILSEEFLASKIYIAMVDNVEEAITVINTHSGGHSASIITSNADKAQHFQAQVDCAAVYHNASTRFTDGGQFGFGSEIAISTQKMHFRGPVGVGQLVTNKWFIQGSGQVRK